MRNKDCYETISRFTRRAFAQIGAILHGNKQTNCLRIYFFKEYRSFEIEKQYSLIGIYALPQRSDVLKNGTKHDQPTAAAIGECRRFLVPNGEQFHSKK